MATFIDFLIFFCTLWVGLVGFEKCWKFCIFFFWKLPLGKGSFWKTHCQEQYSYLRRVSNTFKIQRKRDKRDFFSTFNCSSKLPSNEVEIVAGCCYTSINVKWSDNNLKKFLLSNFRWCYFQNIYFLFFYISSKFLLYTSSYLQ